MTKQSNGLDLIAQRAVEGHTPNDRVQVARPGKQP
ncbi:hypothetical protein ACVIRO_002372 [Rhizobium ruizarguesonis]